MKSKSLNNKIKKFENGDRLYFHRYRLSNAEYHQCHIAVSSTALKELYYGENPKLCYERYIKRSLPQKQSEAMLIGSATHKLILEPRSFHKEFAVYDGFKRGKAWESFKEDHQGLDIISQSQFDDIRKLRDAVRAHPEAHNLLKNGEAEQSVFWRDKETGLLCRARADYNKIQNGSKILVDLKTCQSAHPKKFASDLIKLNYPLQEAMYRDGFQADAFAFIAVEKGDMPVVEVYTLDDLFDECGKMIYRKALEKWAKHREENDWPTYRGGVSQLECPPWFADKILYDGELA